MFQCATKKLCGLFHGELAVFEAIPAQKTGWQWRQTVAAGTDGPSFRLHEPPGTGLRRPARRFSRWGDMKLVALEGRHGSLSEELSVENLSIVACMYRPYKSLRLRVYFDTKMPATFPSPIMRLSR